MDMQKQNNPKDPATITTHSFTPRGEWWTTCGHINQETQKMCGLGEAAHLHTEVVRPNLAPRAKELS